MRLLEELTIIEDSLSLETPCTSRWSPQFLLETHIFSLETSIFSLETPRFSFGDLHIFIGDPQILVGDPHRVSYENMGSPMKI